MVNTFYTILFLLSLVLVVVLIAGFGKKVSVNFVFLFVSTIVINYGYMQLVASRCIESAVYANQTVYLGAAFCPFFLLMSMAELCKIHITRMVKVCLVAWGTLLFAMTSTVGTVDWYYKGIKFVRENGMGRLIKDYGPLHVIYPIYIVVTIVLAFGFIIYSFYKRKEVSYNTTVLLMISTILTASTYAVEKLMDMKFSVAPLAYLFSQVCILLTVKRVSLYDITRITGKSIINSHTYGFILYDSKGRYLGCDVAAKIWFPELLEINVDSLVKEENTALLKQIGDWRRGKDERKIVYFEVGDKIIEGRLKKIKENRNKIVNCIYLRDDTKQQQYAKLMEKYNENLERDVNEKTAKLERIQHDIIISMASIVENRDNNTGGHIARTSDIMKIFVAHLQKKNKFEMLTPNVAKCLIKAAPLHDFGKTAIPDNILNKKGKFEDWEYEIMKKHSEKGAVIVEKILHNTEDEEFKKIAVDVAHYHHEKWDGSGYPEGLKGEEIPFEARVMALADVFDALVSKRVYKESFSYDKAFGIIEESCGSHFEPELCMEFMECRQQLEDLYDLYSEDE